LLAFSSTSTALKVFSSDMFGGFYDYQYV